MTDSTLAGLCRLTVRTPIKNIDLAVPADIPVADLLPALLTYGGDDLAEAGLEHGGWVLQRLGGEPLDEEASLDSQNLRDGETLFLRPRTEALPEVHLDDLVDGISTTMQTLPYGWSPRISRRIWLGCAVAALAAGAVVLAMPGPSAILRAAGAAVAGLLLLAGAGSASRAVGDAGAGAALGAMGIAYLALAGGLLPGGELSGPHLHEVLGARLLAGSAAAAGAAVLAVAAVAAFTSLFLALAAVAVAGALAGVLILVGDLPPQHAAGAVALAAVVFGAFVPSLSFRMAGFRMAPLPTNAEQLQEGIEPHSPTAIAERAVLADGWMTGLYGAAGAICAGCLIGLARDSNLPQALTTAVLSLLLLLHGRGLGNTVQRLSLMIPGVLGGLLLVRVGYLTSGPDLRLLLVAGLLAATAALAVAAWTVPGRRLLPYWGRAAEVLHSAVAIALLPLALWVLDVYGALHALKG
ncbi:type VII secretion integral membrane protein EccD [Streptomyces sp. NPDC048279]|uniref:type VII secretion integral membrane protein EccD n=1 Tax=Streptomyces sp. NPDC048279 TaxID=3154714 RepID=UPI003442C823